MSVDVQSGQAFSSQVKQEEKNYYYKTKLEFIDTQRGKREIVSIVAPNVTPFGGLQFLLEDRLVIYPLSVVFSWSTERLAEVSQSKLILIEK